MTAAVGEDLLGRLARYKKFLDEFPSEGQSAPDHLQNLHVVLKKLDHCPICFEHLKASRIGKTVNAFRKFANPIGSLANALVAKWKGVVTAAMEEQGVEQSSIGDATESRSVDATDARMNGGHQAERNESGGSSKRASAGSDDRQGSRDDSNSSRVNGATERHRAPSGTSKSQKDKNSHSRSSASQKSSTASSDIEHSKIINVKIEPGSKSNLDNSLFISAKTIGQNSSTENSSKETKSRHRDASQKGVSISSNHISASKSGHGGERSVDEKIKPDRECTEKSTKSGKLSDQISHHESKSRSRTSQDNSHSRRHESSSRSNKLLHDEDSNKNSSSNSSTKSVYYRTAVGKEGVMSEIKTELEDSGQEFDQKMIKLEKSKDLHKTCQIVDDFKAPNGRSNDKLSTLANNKLLADTGSSDTSRSQNNNALHSQNSGAPNVHSNSRSSSQHKRSKDSDSNLRPSEGSTDDKTNAKKSSSCNVVVATASGIKSERSTKSVVTSKDSGSSNRQWIKKRPSDSDDDSRSKSPINADDDDNQFESFNDFLNYAAPVASSRKRSAQNSTSLTKPSTKKSRSPAVEDVADSMAKTSSLLAKGGSSSSKFKTDVDVGVSSKSGKSNGRKSIVESMEIDIVPRPLEPLTLSVDDLMEESANDYQRRIDALQLQKSAPGMEVEDQDDLLAGIKHNKRTKVYSGKKQTFLTAVPTLRSACLRVVADNLDALEYVGAGIPYEILAPVFDQCTVSQLLNIEHFNPQFSGETDYLWKVHCKRDFRGSEPDEMESWSELYLRKMDEREDKLKSITRNICASRAKAVPIRATKLAYIHTTVKPPREVRRQQARNCTGGSSALSRHHKTPTSRESAPRKSAPRESANQQSEVKRFGSSVASSGLEALVSSARQKVFLEPDPQPANAVAPVRQSAAAAGYVDPGRKMVKATPPLMQKTLKFMKSLKRR